MAQLSTIIASYKKRTIGVVRDSCDELSTRTVYRTPVDTGLLRKSWTPALNRFDNSNLGGLSSLVTARMETGDAYTFTNGQDYGSFDTVSAKRSQCNLRADSAQWID